MAGTVKGDQLRPPMPAAERERPKASISPRLTPPPTVKSQDSAEDAGSVTSTFLSDVIKEAVAASASDIHFEIYSEKSRIRFRLNGVLKEMRSMGGMITAYYHAVVARLKILCALNIAERRLPQDGAFSTVIGTKKIDFRVSFLPTKMGERVVIRILDAGSFTGGLDGLEMSLDTKALCAQAIRQSQGLILVTGPTGSGKSTTLYSMIRELNSEERSILTAEDPIEYQLDGVNQVQVKDDIGFTFSSALRSFLRQDPEVILVGEIRDQETADIAIKASLTGHLVLSTLHTNDAISTVVRLINMGVKEYLLSPSINLIIAQRLVRSLCPVCAISADESQDALFRDYLERYPSKLYPKARHEIKMAVGCKHCNQTGYLGRMALFEVLAPSDEFRALISQSADASKLTESAKNSGMATLNQAGALAVLSGKTSVSEILRVLGS